MSRWFHDARKHPGMEVLRHGRTSITGAELERQLELTDPCDRGELWWAAWAAADNIRNLLVAPAPAEEKPPK